MKKTTTLLFVLTIFISAAFAQNCPTSALVNGNGNRLFLDFASAADATAYFNAAAGLNVTYDPSRTGPVEMSSVSTRLRIPITGAALPSGAYTGTVTIPGGLACSFSLGALPVNLTSFTTKKMTKSILLEWETKSEINNDGFIIERGDKNAYGMEWNRFGFVEGNGTTQEVQVYSFEDENPAEGINYYRLKQMDYDGKYEYSSIIAVDYASETGSAPIAIFPNPAKGQLTINNAVGLATIYNVFGKPVKQITIESSQNTIELSELLNGQYYLKVLRADGTIVSKQFAKVN